jgi:2-oxoglutarate dehydrogenase E2 component (dihydrolipoamide succinyltransferase)
MNRVAIVMPQMGQSVAEGTIIRWDKAVGDGIDLDEVVLEVETDKTSVEVESPASGVLVSCLKEEGELAAAGEVIGYLEVEIDDMPADSAKPHVDAQDQITVTAYDFNTSQNADSPPGHASLSPSVCRLALENDVTLPELEQIDGTGRNGRVTKRDLRLYLANQRKSSNGRRAKPVYIADHDQTAPMSSLRQTIADHMVQSIRTSAHVTMVHEVDLTEVVALRGRYKEAFHAQFGCRLSYTAAICYAVSRVLPDFPDFNASVSGTDIVWHQHINMGFAVAVSKHSLVVPVIHDINQLDFPAVCKRLGTLMDQAREGKLKHEDIENSTFTMSNFGAYGSLMGTPIINQPEVGILGMGAIFKAPVVHDDEIVIRHRMYLSLSFDHRVIDGALGGQFLKATQDTIESLDATALSLDQLDSAERFQS